MKLPVTSIVERAARAISMGIYETEEAWPRCVDDAKAVLRAIREPSEAMIEAGDGADYECSEGVRLSQMDVDLRIVWQAMLDAALRDPS